MRCTNHNGSNNRHSESGDHRAATDDSAASDGTAAADDAATTTAYRFDAPTAAARNKDDVGATAAAAGSVVHSGMERMDDLF